MSLSSTLSNLLAEAGLQIIHKRVYRTQYLAAEAERLMQPVLPQYNALIRQYPTKADHRKAEENYRLFIVMLHWLNLHKRPACKILDIGGRAGLFAYYCRSYGHDAYVSDLPQVLQKSPNKELLDIFQVKSIPLEIKAFEPLNADRLKFDLITGFRTRFHSKLPHETGREHEEHWGVKEWDYFLNDIAKNILNKNGQIFFMLNRLHEHEKKGYAPKELTEYFKNKGGRMKQQFLFFSSINI